MHYLIISLILLFSYPTFSTCLPSNIVDGEFIVVGSSTTNSFSAKISSFKGLEIKKISSNKKGVNNFSTKTGTSKNDDLFLVKSNSIDKVKEVFKDSKVQNNCIVQSFSSDISTDTFYNFQRWYLDSMGLNYSPITNQRSIVIAISDTGTNINHPDLVGNLWANTSELNGSPGVDDDGNGFIDDVHGYDFGDNDSNPVPSVNDAFIDFDHGTHVAGLVSAKSFNNDGISGVALNSVKIMALKGFKSNAPSTVADLLQTIYYAVDNGADIINASWGTEKTPEAAEIAAVNYAVQNGVAIVAAAGNDRVPASWFVPAGIKNVITVGSLNSRNQLSTFSNYGNLVDFVAPGGDGGQRLNEGLLSAGISSDYMELKGTSMSAPLIAGAMGLIMSQRGGIDAYQAAHVLERSGTKYTLNPYLQNNSSETYTKPNITSALQYLADHPTIPNVRPEIEDIGSYNSQSLASSSGGSGGCSNSLASHSIGDSTTMHSSPQPLSFVLILLPILIAINRKRALKKPSSKS